MKQLEAIQPPVTRFERQTGNCPLLVATIMLDQLKNYFWAELPDDLADEAAAKAETVFAGNVRWRRKFQGRHGRKYLEMLLRHWFSSALFRRKSPLFRRLPPEFKVGGLLPDVSLPRQQEMKAKKRGPIQKTAENYENTHGKSFVHGSEFLPL